MKQFVKPALIAAAITILSVTAVSAADSKPFYWLVTDTRPADNSFSVELNQMVNNEVVFLTIKNPAKKNLSVTLNGPDGFTVDNFFTGKKLNQLDKKYNFTAADAGVYTIVVSDGINKIKKQIKLERIAIKEINTITVQ